AGAVTVRGNHDRWCLEGTGADLRNGHRLDALAPGTAAFLQSLPKTYEALAPDGTPVLLCHGLAANDMNGIREDDLGYALEVNDDLVELRGGGRRIVVKGHRHQPAIWHVGQLTLIDAGTLLDEHTFRCGVVLDLSAMRAVPLSLDDAGLTELEPVGLAA